MKQLVAFCTPANQFCSMNNLNIVSKCLNYCTDGYVNNKFVYGTFFILMLQLLGNNKKDDESLEKKWEFSYNEMLWH